MSRNSKASKHKFSEEMSEHPTFNPPKKRRVPAVIFALWFKKEDGKYHRTSHPDLKQLFYDAEEDVILCNFGEKQEIRQGIIRTARKEARKKRGNLLFEVKSDE